MRPNTYDRIVGAICLLLWFIVTPACIVAAVWAWDWRWLVTGVVIFLVALGLGGMLKASRAKPTS